MAGFTIPGLVGATALALIINASPVATWTPDAPPPDPPGQIVWDGDPAMQLLTVSANERMMSEGARFAPYAIEIDATVVGGAFTRPTTFTDFDPTFSKYQYVLLTSDLTLGRNTRVPLPEHRLRDFRIGQQCKHVWGGPGTYQWQLYVYAPDGKWGKTPPQTVVVSPVEDKIPAARTIVVSNTPGETWALAPPHDVANRCTTMQAAINRFNTLKSGGSVRISARNGGTYAEVVTVPGNGFRFTTGRWICDTWDNAGERVTIDPGISFVGGSPSSPPTFNNWRMVYTWDKLRDLVKVGAPTGAPGAGPLNLSYVSTDYEANPQTILHNCDIVNTRAAPVYYASAPTTQAVIFNDCHLEALGDYITLDNRHIGFLNSWVSVPFGSALNQLGRERAGGGADFGMNHNSFRAWNGSLYCDGSFVEGRGGWSGQSAGFSLWDTQAIVRSAGTGSVPGQKNQFVRSVMIGNIQLATDGSQSIFDSNVLVDDPALRVGQTIMAVSGGHSFRNNFMIVLPGGAGLNLLEGRNTGKFELGMNVNGRVCTTFLDIGSSTITQNRDLEILHNTLIVHRNAANMPSVRTPLYSGTPATGVEIQGGHNVIYAPDHGEVPSGGVQFIDQLNWTVQDVWMRTGWEIQKYTLPANVGPGQQTPLIPYPNEFRGTQTVQADYAGTINRQSVWVDIGGQQYNFKQLTGGFASAQQLPDTITLTYEATGFRILNRHASLVWPAGEEIIVLLDRGTTLEDPLTLFTIDQSKKRLVRPNTPQALTAGQPRCLFDFSMRRLRPNAGFAISPTTGVDAAGALLPVA